MDEAQARPTMVLAKDGGKWLGAVKIVRRDRHASIDSFGREFKGLQKFEHYGSS